MKKSYNKGKILVILFIVDIAIGIYKGYLDPKILDDIINTCLNILSQMK